jgi:hypothetical protein
LKGVDSALWGVDDGAVEVRRSELYEQVWTVPMSTLSKKYGLSDVGLAKICKKHDIPRPPRGYWAKREALRTSKQIPLSPNKTDEVIRISPNRYRDSGPEKTETASDEGGLKDLEVPIQVSEDLRKPHPLVKRSAEILQSLKPDHRGIVIPQREHCLDIQVSKNSLRRAHLIMDSLIKALEERGCEVRLSGGETEVRILDTVMGISISEQLVSEKQEPKDPDFNGDYRFGHSRYEKKYSSSGNLCLAIRAGVYLDGYVRQSWSDGKQHKIEDNLNAFIRSLSRTAIQKKENIKKREQEERERIEREKRWAIERRRAEEEKEKFDKLVSAVEDWHKSRRIREYIAKVEEMAATGKYTFNFEGGLDNWLKWAKEAANRLDPLCPAPGPPKGSQENAGGDPPKSSA